MKDKDVFRVAVGKADVLQSSVWRFWINKNEIYVAARETSQLLKLSLHSSGTWRLAYLTGSEINDPLIKDSDPRVIARWKQPPEFNNGWTQCLDIIIPAVSVKKPFVLCKGLEPKGSLQWVDLLPPRHREQITVLVADTRERNIHDVIQVGGQVLNNLSLQDGRTMWITSRRSKMTNTEQKEIKLFTEDLKINYDTDPGGQIFAAGMIIDTEQQHPIISNFALGWENIYVAGNMQ